MSPTMQNSALEQGTSIYVKTAMCIGGLPFQLDLLAKHNGKFSVVVSLVKLASSGALAMTTWLGKPPPGTRLFR